MIRVDQLVKTFRVHRRPPGMRAALRSVFKRNYESVRAVAGVSFRIDRGERVGFLGPNGAGKTTTLKVLSGLLHPTSGSVVVNGFEPRRREPAFLKGITLVMGQKNQLSWDLPASETYELNRALFDVPRAEFDATMAELAGLLDLENLSSKPSRQLSLGERMKCELAAALLHRPTTLFLDEPTIGLDVSMQVAIREFIRSYNQRYEATVLLTSHYMQDVTALCPRVIVIDKGQLIYDGDLRALVRKMHPSKLVSFTLSGPVTPDQLERLGEVVSSDSGRVVLRVPQNRLRDVVSHSLASLPMVDLSVEDPPVEDIMRQLFQGEPSSPGEEPESAASGPT
ncbi:MAG TPA: ATP-binding cassette domain-containing protein [Kofleriaceae bacterium]|nr:ATP-binding cassette domain-containing protein [Kofleriaceae bacterium]